MVQPFSRRRHAAQAVSRTRACWRFRLVCCGLWWSRRICCRSKFGQCLPWLHGLLDSTYSFFTGLLSSRPEDVQSTLRHLKRERSRGANAKLHTTIGSRNGVMLHCGLLVRGSTRFSSRFWRMLGEKCRSGCGRLSFVRHEARGGRIPLHASRHPFGPLRHDAAFGAVAQSDAQQLCRKSAFCHKLLPECLRTRGQQVACAVAS